MESMPSKACGLLLILAAIVVADGQHCAAAQQAEGAADLPDPADPRVIPNNNRRRSSPAPGARLSRASAPVSSASPAPFVRTSSSGSPNGSLS